MKRDFVKSINSIRQFSRFFTNKIGLLTRRLPLCDYSLQEARIIYEIGHERDCTAKSIKEHLNIDPAYLSRVLLKLGKTDLIIRTRSKSDKRTFYLCLTASGKKVLKALERNSNENLEMIIGKLSNEELEEIIRCMDTIQKIMSKDDFSEKSSGNCRRDGNR